METKIEDLIDLKKIDSLLEKFSKVTGFVTAIIDLKGNVLSQSGWSKVCNNFHRTHPQTLKKCIYSDTILANQCKSNYHAYTCENGLTDVVIPLKIEGKHIGNIFTGQFFWDKPDIAFFKKQAKKYGFDEEEYLAAIQNVPIVSEEKVKEVSLFLLQMTDIISEIGLEKQEQITLNKNLFESEKKFKSLYDNAPLSYQSLDEKGYFIDVNPTWLKTLGYKREEVIGHKYSDFLHPSMQEHFKKNFPIFKKRGYIHDVQFLIKHKLGHFLYISFEGCIGYNADGSFRQTYCVFKDITEQKKYEEALIQNQMRLQSLFDYSPIPLWEEDFSAVKAYIESLRSKIKDLKKCFLENANEVKKCAALVRILDCNKAVLTLHETTKKEVLLKNLSYIFTETSYENFRKQLFAIIDNQTKCEFDSTIKTINGKVKHVAVRWQVVAAFQDSYSKVYVTTADISERKNFQDLLMKSETRYRELVNTINSGVAIYKIINDGKFGSDYIIQDFNRFALHHEKLKKEEVIGKTLQDIRPNIQNFGLLEVFRQVWKTGESAFFPAHIYKDNKFSNYYENRVFKLSSGEIVAIYDDVTERELAHAKLAKNQALLKNIIENSTNLFYSHSIDGTITFISPQVKELIGYDTEEAKQNWTAFITDNPINNKAIEYTNAAIETGRRQPTYELEMLCKDKEKIIVEVREAPIVEDGKVTAIVGSLANITERKIAEQQILQQNKEYEVLNEELRQTNENLFSAIHEAEVSNDRFNKAMEVTSDGLWDWDLITNEIYYSPRWKEMLGYKDNELQNDFAVWEKLTQPEDVKRSWEMLEDLSQGKREKFDIDFKMKHKNGNWIDINSRANIFRNNEGKLYRIVGTHTDITAQKKAKNKMRFLSAITENMKESIIVTNLDHKISYINKSAQQLFGYCPAELIGKKPAILNIDPHQEEILKSILKALEKKEAFYGEALYRRKNGSQFICEFSITPLTDNQGNVTSYIGMQRDVTEIRNLEKAAIRHERLSAIGELASGVAHDFNNALQIILGGIEMALIIDAEEEKRQYLESIKKSANDAASRVRQLQRFSQKNQQKKRTSFLDINILANDVIKEAKLLLNQYQQKGLHFTLESKLSAKNDIEGNEGELRSCLFNLLKNSIEAMPDGGAISVHTYNDKRKIYVQVTDTGIGMDQETQLKIFQPFYSTKGFEPGRGLGMAQVYSTIREHKGDIVIKESEIGKGTTIEFSLPISQDKPTLRKASKDYDGIAKVLWVDDEEMIRIIGKKMLQALGHNADFAASGKEALQKLETGMKYDLIITDIGMPEMSGWQLAEKIKEMGYHSRIAVVTGWGSEISQEAKKKYNVGYVLGKPIELKDLKSLIGEVLQMKKI